MIVAPARLPLGQPRRKPSLADEGCQLMKVPFSPCIGWEMADQNLVIDMSQNPRRSAYLMVSNGIIRAAACSGPWSRSRGVSASLCFSEPRPRNQPETL
jgi:hypothetical protein